MQYPKLNYPPIHLRARHGEGGRVEIFDKGRGRWLVLTPEEWVRQHVVEFMRTTCGFQPEQIAEEHPIGINNMAQRADIVAFDNHSKPYIIVECKEPNIKIDDSVFAQAVRYNSVLHCPYIVITNGLSTYCYATTEDEGYRQIDHFPTLR